jgi:hypothetical protein
MLHWEKDGQFLYGQRGACRALVICLVGDSLVGLESVAGGRHHLESGFGGMLLSLSSPSGKRQTPWRQY